VKLKIFSLLLLLLLLSTGNSYAYMDPVSASVFYQVIAFIFSGIIIFFTKLKIITQFFYREFKYSQISLIFFSLIPLWVFNKGVDFLELLIVLFIFFVLCLIFNFLLNLLKKKDLNIAISVIVSFLITFGLDDKLGLASIINAFTISSIIRYLGYFIFFIILNCIFFIIYKKNNTKIINIFIFFLIISNFKNLFFYIKNINLFFDY